MLDDGLKSVRFFDGDNALISEVDITNEKQIEGHRLFNLYKSYVVERDRSKSKFTVLCAKGSFLYREGLKWSPSYLDDEKFTYVETERGLGVRSCRRLTRALFDLLETGPDALILGPGMQDWLVDVGFGQPKVDVQEFSVIMGWAVDVVCQGLKVPLVFLFSQPSGESADLGKGKILSQVAAEPYLRSLRALAEVNPLFSVINVTECVEIESDFFNPGVQGDAVKGLRTTGEKLFPILQAEVERLVRKADAEFSGEQEVCHRLNVVPVPPAEVQRLEVVTADGEAHKVTSPYWNTVLSLGFRHRPFVQEDDGVDEGGVIADKIMESVGGRNFEERYLQFMLLQWLHRNHSDGLKRVMIVGDSIRMRILDVGGYGVYAYGRLLGKCNLLHNPHNCGNSQVSKDYLTNWLKYEPDIIHINHGLHDCAVRPKTGQPAKTYISPENYRKNLEYIVRTVRECSEATLIWGLCTPVDEQWHTYIPGKDRLRAVIRRNEDIRLYNEIASDVMSKHGVSVTDLYTPMLENGLHNYILPDGVHLNQRGGVLVGQLVADAVLRHL